LVSQPHVKLPLWIIPASAPETKAATLTILDGSEWKAGDAPQRLPEGVLRAAADGKPAIRAAVAPRGVGPVKWTGDARKQIQIRRRFMLLGQTLDGMRVWDIRQSIAALKSLGPLREVELRAGGAMGVNALYAALFEPEVKRLRLENIPTTLETAPDYFNVARVLPVERAIELARERGIEVVLEGAEREGGR
jgi:hypothetical protein